MVTNNVLSRTNATVDSVSSLSVNLKQHPNFVKSSNQLKYCVFVRETPSSIPRRFSQETDRIVSLTADVKNLKKGPNIDFIHGYLSDLPLKISARNENCALLAPSDAFHPLIEAEYTTRKHLIRNEVPIDSPGVIDKNDSIEQEKKCARTTKKRTIGDLFAKMKNATARPEKLETSIEKIDPKRTKSSKMQYGDHEYCSTKYPLVKAFQKQASKIRNPKPPPQLIVKTEEPLPEVSAASSSKRQWIDTSSSDDEQKSAQPSATSKSLTKRLRGPAKQDPSQSELEKMEVGGGVPSKPRALPKANVTREGASTSKRSSRSATKKTASQTQAKTVLSFVKKSSK